MRYLRYLKHLIIVAFIALYCSMSSCNYLNVDDYFMDTLGYDSIFQNKLNLQQYLWGTAAFFYDEGAIWGSIHRELSVRMKLLLCGTMMSIRVRNLCWEI